MIKQFRLDRFNGVEYLVCEFFEKHTWSQAEVDAYSSFMDTPGSIHIGFTRDEFRILLDEWCEVSRSDNESFYGLREPIPVIDSVPHMVIRSAVYNNRLASLQVDFMPTVTPLEVIDGVQSMYDFIRSPHWRNTISLSISRYGSLFGSDNDS